jgi:hypothetical protein
VRRLHGLGDLLLHGVDYAPGRGRARSCLGWGGWAARGGLAVRRIDDAVADQGGSLLLVFCALTERRQDVATVGAVR